MSKTRENRKPRILVLELSYGSVARCVQRHGADVTCVNPRLVDDVEKALAVEWDGLVLSGGGDIDPRLYDEKPHRKVYGVNAARDLSEMIALDLAADQGIPVLGICRGAQMIAVHNGGRLKQHIGGHRGIDHLVFTEPSSRFRRVVGRAGLFVSLHHQVILRHGSNFRVAGRDRTGLIEAIESKDGRVLGVQFHPEMDHGTNLGSRQIFDWLVAESARRAGLVAPRKPRRPKRAAPATLPGLEKPKRKRPVQKGVKVSWLCPQCGIRFDKVEDREDHMYWIHGIGMPTMRTTTSRRRAEPPPGHKDWTS